MKLIPAFLFFTAVAFAQEIQPVSAEQAVKIARKVTAALGSPGDVPIAVDADVEKPAGIKAGSDAGLLAIPDKKFTPETLAGTSTTVTALGQLWMRNVALAVNGTAADPAKLRTVKVNDGEKDVSVEVYHLGIAKSDAGGIELNLFAKDKEPLVRVPLVKTDAAASTTPIALDGHKEGENSGVLVITVFGSYKADVTVTKPRE